MATEIKVGLAGFGNVGKGTYDILKRNHSLIRQRAGAPISVKRVTVHRPPANCARENRRTRLWRATWFPFTDDSWNRTCGSRRMTSIS